MLLWLADGTSKQTRDEYTLKVKDVALIGFAQALALIPGTSRSGITMTGGLFAGLTSDAAARFSFLLAIPVIVLASGLETVKVVQGDMAVTWWQLALGFFVSMVTAFACIHYFLKALKHIGFMPFIIYRIALGALLIYNLL